MKKLLNFNNKQSKDLSKQVTSKKKLWKSCICI